MKRALWLLLVSARAIAASDSYLTLTLEGANLTGRWDIGLNDLDFVLAVDANADGAITWGEVKAKRDAIVDYAIHRIGVRAEGEPCPLTAKSDTVDAHRDGSYVVVTLNGTCKRAPESLDVEYHLLFDEDLRHRGHFTLVANDTQEALFSPAEPGRRFSLTSSSRFRRWLQGLVAGFREIWAHNDR